MIGRVRLYPRLLVATALDLDINQTTGTGDHEYVRKSMHTCHSVSVACRPAEKRWRRGELGSIHRSILVVTGDPIGRKGLSWYSSHKRVCFTFFKVLHGDSVTEPDNIIIIIIIHTYLHWYILTYLPAYLLTYVSTYCRTYLNFKYIPFDLAYLWLSVLYDSHITPYT